MKEDKEYFNQDLLKIEISPIVAISEAMKGRNDVFHFYRGEINLNTPQQIINNIKKALDEGKTKYPKSAGELPLKQHILEKLKKYNKINGLIADNIIVTAGGQEALNILFHLFYGRECASFSPVWSVVVEDFNQYSHQNINEIPFNKDMSINWERTENALAKSRFLYLNSPHNPTGKIFSEDELRKILELCKKNNTFIISDEAYEHIVFDDKKHISIASLPEAKDYENSIATVYTFSKTFALTGGRVGYIVTKNEKLTKVIKNTQYTHTAGIPTFIQYGLVGAYDLEDEIKNRRNELQKRRDIIYETIAKIDKISCSKPEGAFYFWLDLSKIAEDGYNYMLEKTRICGVPGTAFTKQYMAEYKPCVRLSYSAVDSETIEEMIDSLYDKMVV